jgi:hypothetical protein
VKDLKGWIGKLCVKEGRLADAPHIFCPFCGHNDERWEKALKSDIVSGQWITCKCLKKFVVNVNTTYTSWKGYCDKLEPERDK